MIAVERPVGPIGWDLVTGKSRGVIAIVGPGILVFGDVILTRLPIIQERAEERAGGIVLDVELNADSFKLRLQEQLIISAPDVVGRRRVLELQALPTRIREDPVLIFRGPAIRRQ